MKIIVLGAGIQGVTTAYFLQKDGHDVTVIERQSEAAMECSFANGGQLSYCHAEPWASPASLKKAIGWIFRKDAPLVLHFRADPQMWLWLLRFISNCREKRVRENTLKILKLGLYSKKIMNEVQESLNLDFSYKKKGILHIFRDEKALEGEVRQSEFQKPFGSDYKLLSVDQCLEVEPALKNIASTLKGAVHYNMDESGDTHFFAKHLGEECSKGENPVNFLYNTTIKDIRVGGGKIYSIQTDKGDIEGDCFVMTMGSYSPIFLRKIGVKVPIYPMKGYSISIKVGDDNLAPRASITDQAERAVYTRFDGIFRAGGTAEFGGYNDKVTKTRIDLLKRKVRENFPDCGDIENAEEWSGLRSSTPSGVPVLGKCKYDNLYLNTGHGTLGWTLALGSGKIISDIIEGRSSEYAT